MTRHLAWAVALLVALAGCSAGRSFDTTKFEPLHRAGRELREHVAGGVTLPVYREAIGKYATEVSLAAEKASGDREHEFVASHQKALEAFRDALTVWELKFKRRVPADTPATAADAPELPRLIDEYPITGKGSGATFAFSLDDAQQTIWTRATGSLAIADGIYLNTPP